LFSFVFRIPLNLRKQEKTYNSLKVFDFYAFVPQGIHKQRFLTRFVAAFAAWMSKKLKFICQKLTLTDLRIGYE